MAWVDERLLADPNAPGAIDYEIVDAAFNVAVAFRTGSVNDRTPSDTAIGNLLDYSEYHDGVFAVRRKGAKTFAYAHGGVGWDAEALMVDRKDFEVEVLRVLNSAQLIGSDHAYVPTEALVKVASFFSEGALRLATVPEWLTTRSAVVPRGGR